MAIILKIKVYQKKQDPFLLYDDQLEMFKIYISAVREKGKANKEIISSLSHFFHIPQYCFTIISGKTTTIKLIKIETEMKLNDFVLKINNI